MCGRTSSSKAAGTAKGATMRGLPSAVVHMLTPKVQRHTAQLTGREHFSSPVHSQEPALQDPRPKPAKQLSPQLLLVSTHTQVKGARSRVCKVREF